MTLCCRQHKLIGFFGRGDSVPVALADIIPPPRRGLVSFGALPPRVSLPPSLMRYGVTSRRADFLSPRRGLVSFGGLAPGFRCAFGETRLFDDNFADGKFDRKSDVSTSVSSNMYSGGNLAGLLRTASFIRFVSTPYNSATSASRITGSSRTNRVPTGWF